MSSDSQWHIERSRIILRQYPEIKQYFGNYPPSILEIALLVALQWLIAWLVKDLIFNLGLLSVVVVVLGKIGICSRRLQSLSA
ncbi:MAG: hypothetical protein ACFCU7_05010 [Pleurocapsa sp.]